MEDNKKFIPELNVILRCLTTYMDDGAMGVYNSCDKCMIAIVKNGNKTFEHKVQANSSTRIWHDGPFQLIGEKTC